MRNTEIIDTYFSHRGLRRVGGDSLEPILPFIILDTEYQQRCKYIRPTKVKFGLKKAKATWCENYNALNQDFFRTLDNEQTDYVIAKMEHFEGYISEEIGKVKETIKRRCSWLPMATQEVLATTLLCNILIQAAQSVWGRVYKQRDGLDNINTNIMAMQKASYTFGADYCPETRNVKCQDSDDMKEVVNALCHKIVGWLYIDENKDC